MTFNLLLKTLLLLAFGILIFFGIRLIIITSGVYEQSLKLATEHKTPQYLCTTCIKDGYAQALLFFTLALGILFLIFLLPRLQTISFGGINISLKELQQDIQNLKVQSNQIQETITDSGGGKSISVIQLQNMKNEVLENKIQTSDNDPHKGKWGGLSESNGRKISAAVSKSPVPGLYRVSITVVSVKPDKPLKGFVQFHLHPTFRNPDPVIAVSKGKAVLNLKFVYGAFTVGAEADNGDTALELDLAELPGITDEFKNA